ATARAHRDTPHRGGSGRTYDLKQILGTGIPEACRPVGTGSDERAPIGRERGGDDGFAMAREDREARTVVGVEEMCISVSARDHDEATVRAERRSRRRVERPDRAEVLLPRPDVPNHRRATLSR